MTRVKRGFKARRRRKKVFQLAEGYRGTRKNLISVALHVVQKGLVYAYRDRRAKKRDFRALWILRINAEARANGLKYSQFMFGLKKSGIELDRSVLADLALSDKPAFLKLVQQAKASLSL